MTQGEGTAIAPGRGRGPVIRLAEPLSFWGGVDASTGTVIDRRHPQRGAVVTRTILVMPGGRGSSSSSTVLAECVRAATAPAAILLASTDPILAIGSTVAAALYGTAVPIVVVGAPTFDLLREGAVVDVEAHDDGTASIRPVGDAPG